ncbi:hypothetical protein [Mesorhizobium robiniae]|uniref:hypothetical protein n=1 Tax=Mesorhizobium robiniae TaxID=559315 RepID=UPI003393AF14
MIVTRPSLCLIVLLGLGVVGCQTKPEPDYSPGYSYVSTGKGSAKGADGSVLAPDACLGEPADTDPSLASTSQTITPQLGPHLPPGCANAYNLQRMVESQRDILDGRRMGPSSAAPGVRAAKRYLYGEEAGSLGGANNQDQSDTGN